MDSRKKERPMYIDIYTDGSLKSIGDVTFGGWAFIALKDTTCIQMDSGSELTTTNQRMELTAILKALEYAQSIRRPSEKVVIYSDSAYAVNCYLQQWYLGWRANGWVNAKGKEVANQDLWLKIIPFFENFWYDFRKVKGHEDVYWNVRCDELAQQESQILKSNWRGKTI